MKKVIISLLALFVVGATAINLKNVLRNDLKTSKLTLEAIEALTTEGETAPPAGTTQSYTCTTRGPGSRACSVTFELSGANASCSVECYEGYYSCCNRLEAKCQCRKY